MDHGPLGKRGDGRQRVDADRAWDDRPVADIEPAMHALAVAIEHLAFVVAHASARILAYAAAAERMRGRRLGPHAGHGKRALDIARTDRLRRAGQSLVDARVDRLVGDARPLDGGAAVVEPDLALRLVMRDDEEGMEVRERALIDALDQAVRRAKQPAARDEEHRKQRRERRRENPLLDDHAAVEMLAVWKLDLACDAGADHISDIF